MTTAKARPTDGRNGILATPRAVSHQLSAFSFRVSPIGFAIISTDWVNIIRSAIAGSTNNQPTGLSQLGTTQIEGALTTNFTKSKLSL
jgi:hypothetical protein